MNSPKSFLRPACALLAVFVAVVVAPSASAQPNYKAVFGFAHVNQLTADPDGRVWFIGQAAGSKHANLYVATASGRATRVRLPNKAKSSATITSVGLGGDGRVWAAFKGTPTARRTSIFRFSRSGNPKTIVLPRGQTATTITAGSGRRTWFLGYSKRAVGYFDSNFRSHGVALPNASAMESMTVGPDGRMWVSGRHVIRAFTLQGVQLAVKLDSMAGPTPGITSSGGYLWLSGVGSLIRLDAAGGLTVLPLPYPKFTEPQGSHVGYTYLPYRIVYSTFAVPNGQVGFTSGTSMRTSSGNDVYLPSMGTVSRAGSIAESDPNNHEFSPWPDTSSTGDSENPTRRPGVGAATLDTNANLWLATDGTLQVIQAPTF